MESKSPAADYFASLFDIKKSRSTDDIASIFEPSKGMGGNSVYSAATGSSQKQHQDKNTGGSDYNISNKERNSIFQGDGVQPCYLTSSIYYGGQEIYTPSSYSNTSRSYTTYKKDAAEDAAIENWWQGSYYY